jgi:uncharacterized protein (TIGR02246 family)
MPKSQEIEELVNAWAECVRNRDANAMAGLIASEDVTFIGTDPDEFWSGRDKVIEIMRAQFEEFGDDVTVGPVEVDGRALTEEAGYFAGQTSFTTPGGAIPVRVSGAACREAGGWKIAHLHASIGASNEDTIGRQLTT